MAPVPVLDRLWMTEEVEEERNKLFIGGSARWVVVLSPRAQREGTESLTRFQQVLVQSFVLTD